VIVAGCAIKVVILAGNHGLVKINKPVWIALILVSSHVSAAGKDLRNCGRSSVDEKIAIALIGPGLKLSVSVMA